MTFHSNRALSKRVNFRHPIVENKYFDLWCFCTLVCLLYEIARVGDTGSSVGFEISRFGTDLFIRFLKAHQKKASLLLF